MLGPQVSSGHLQIDFDSDAVPNHLYVTWGFASISIVMKRQTNWALLIPGILSFIFLLLALIFNVLRAARGGNASGALIGVGLPVVIGLAVVIVPVVLWIRLSDKRHVQAMAELQSRYPHVYYTYDFRSGPRLLTADDQNVSIWRARMKKLEQEVSWERGTISIEQTMVPISRAVTMPGVAFMDPHNKLWRMVVSDTVTARIKPLDYSAFLPFIQ